METNASFLAREVGWQTRIELPFIKNAMQMVKPRELR